MLPKILSDTVYITENQMDEITSINEVEGEVERPIQNWSKGIIMTLYQTELKEQYNLYLIYLKKR